MKHGTKFLVGKSHSEELGYTDKVGKFAEVVAIENGTIYAQLMGGRYTFCPHTEDVVLLYHHLVAKDALEAAYKELSDAGLEGPARKVADVLSELDNIIFQ